MNVGYVGLTETAIKSFLLLNWIYVSVIQAGCLYVWRYEYMHNLRACDTKECDQSEEVKWLNGIAWINIVYMKKKVQLLSLLFFCFNFCSRG